jgi:hypothetical protein
MLKSLNVHNRLFIKGNWLVYGVIFSLAILLGFLLAREMLLGVGLFAAIIGLAVLLVCILNTEAGLYINIVYSYTICVVTRLFFNDELKVGVYSNILIIATFLGLFLRGSDFRQNFAKFSQTRVAKFFFVYFIYAFAQVVNPYARFWIGWSDPFRVMLMSAMLLLIAYNIFDNYAAIRRFVVIFFVLTSLVAFYGCFQQWHGLFPFEKNWVGANQLRFDLIFITGDYRKWSTFTDPPGFGLMMASSAAFYIVLLSAQRKRTYRLALLAGVTFMILGMLYSGTRTANVQFLSGVFVFVLLTIHKRSTLIVTAIATLGLLVLIFGPFYGNATINRFRSTFIGKKDQSYQVREVNRKFIQPYIYAHPFGGGLGTTGLFGTVLNPGHYLAGFPTDSGYLKTALETGWLGFLIRLAFYFVVLQTGIRSYFASENPRVRMISAGALCMLFSFFVAEFAQEAIGQFTDIVVFWPMIALLLQINKLEEKPI